MIWFVLTLFAFISGLLMGGIIVYAWLLKYLLELPHQHTVTNNVYRKDYSKALYKEEATDDGN